MGAADLGAGATNPMLMTVSAANGTVLTSSATPTFFSSLAVRPSDGVMFGGTGDQQGIWRINPTTGGATLIGETGRNLVGGLAFRSATAPVAVAIEFRHAEWDHYFVTAIANEIAKLDNGTFAGWARTGQSFNVYPLNAADAGPNASNTFDVPAGQVADTRVRDPTMCHGQHHPPRDTSAQLE